MSDNPASYTSRRLVLKDWGSEEEVMQFSTEGNCHGQQRVARKALLVRQSVRLVDGQDGLGTVLESRIRVGAGDVAKQRNVFAPR